MTTFTKVLCITILFVNFFSCARREQALYQRSQREQFARVSPPVAAPMPISQTTSDTNQVVAAPKPDVISASATTHIPVGQAKSTWKTAPLETKPTDDQMSRHQKKAQLRKSVLKKLLSEAPGQTSGLAIASLVCGILSLFILGVVLGPLAVIFGAVALSKISKNPEIKGRGLAVAGLIIGIVATVLIIIYLASR